MNNFEHAYIYQFYSYYLLLKKKLLIAFFTYAHYDTAYCGVRR